jgi:S1-C subfamily serine protease
MPMRCAPPLALLVSAAALALICVATAGCVEADSPAARRARAESFRLTPAAHVYAACRESVVNIGVKRRDAADPNTWHTEFGSGVILSATGHLVTNAHALRFGGTPYVGVGGGGGDFQARVVAVDEAADLAVLKIDAPRRFKPVTVGRSSDLVVGERVVAIGNPFGMGMTVSMGIVSALGRSTKSDFTFFADMIQTDSSANPGSSGGALLNTAGELVGINTTRKTEGQGIGFAIPADRLRAVLPGVLAPAERYGFVMGMEATEADGVLRVSAVGEGSPAARTGVRAGDRLVALGEQTVANVLDVSLALADVRPGRAVPVEVERGGRRLRFEVVAVASPPLPAAQVGPLVPGAVCKVYRGRWEALPDFDALTPAETRTFTWAEDKAGAAAFALGDLAGQDGFALHVAGVIEIGKPGVYAFYTKSDDGSRVWIDGRLVVDNDGTHAAREARGFVPLAAGRHRIVVGFFEGGGDEALTVSWEGPDLPKQPIAAKAVWRE